MPSWSFGRARLGDGNGGFSLAGSVLADASGAIAAADLNGDGHPDIVAANGGYPNGESFFLINNGNGGFSTTYGPVGGETAPSIAVADLNGDGKLDVVLADFVPST